MKITSFIGFFLLTLVPTTLRTAMNKSSTFNYSREKSKEVSETAFDFCENKKSHERALAPQFILFEFFMTVSSQTKPKHCVKQ